MGKKDKQQLDVAMNGNLCLKLLFPFLSELARNFVNSDFADNISVSLFLLLLLLLLLSLLLSSLLLMLMMMMIAMSHYSATPYGHGWQ